MQRIRKRIFGLNINIFCSELNYFKVLNEELKLYPDFDGNHDYTIEILTESDFKYSLNNPSDHFLTENGFAMQAGRNIIEWDFTNFKISIIVKPYVSNLKAFIQKFFNIQFLHPYQEIGQYIHENVFVPLMFFIEDSAPIHCSAISVNGKICLLGGTGGVGKTSTLLALSSEDEVEFITDDILIVSSKDTFHPNFAFPKIYAYNTIGDKKLEQKVVGSNRMGIYQWNFKKKKNISSVRRRISPALLYKITNKAKELNSYYLFSRGDYDDVLVEEYDIEDLAKITSQIIQNEYSEFFNHIIWYELNCKIAKREPLFTKTKIINRIEYIYLHNILPKMALRIIKVPKDIKHSEFKNYMIKLLTSP